LRLDNGVRRARTCAGIATLVRRVDQPSVTVGMDGSFYRFHPEFQRILMKTINDLLDNKYKVSFDTLPLHYLDDFALRFYVPFVTK